MISSDTQTVGEMVAQDWRTASVFQKYGIDFCCKGGQTIEAVCQKKGIDKNDLLADIAQSVVEDDSNQPDFKTWPLDELADYIVDKHHRYINEKTPVILQFLNKLCSVHGQRHPELLEIYQEFSCVANELTMHLKKEEMILFPAVRDMLKNPTSSHEETGHCFGTVQNPINAMRHEHDTEGNRFRRIAELSNNYNTPADGCSTYRVTYQMLQEFEADLHKHIHLENNIMFPRAIALEQSI